MFRKLSTCVLFLLLGTPLAALAQGTGTLAGTVIDGDTGESLPGANVRIEGTQLGAAADLDGNYRIIGVPVGSYDVVASFVGFTDFTETGVDISSGYTTQLDFTLSSGVELEEITVEYERPIIQRDAIGAPRVVSGEDIQNLPIRGVASVAALQGGVVSNDQSSNLNIRGGRSEEVAYYVDGVKVTGLLGVNQAAIQEQEMLIGTIPARYGDVQSGVISITTRSGRDRFFGSAEFVTSEALDAFGYNVGSVSVGGPVIPGGRVGFFLTGEVTSLADSNPYGIDTYRLSDEAFADLQARPQALEFTNEAGEQVFIPIDPALLPADQRGDTGMSSDDLLAALGDQVPDGFTLVSPSPVNRAETFVAEDFMLERGKDDPLTRLTLNGNLNFNLSSALNLRLGGGYETRDDENYSFTNSLYNRDRFYNQERDSYRLYGTFRQRVSESAFYQIQGEFQDFQFVQYPEGFSNDVRDALGYGDAQGAYNATGLRYFNYLNDEYTRAFDADGSTRPAAVQPGSFALSGRPLAT